MLHIPIILSECKCSRFGSKDPNCDDSGNCECKSVFQGPKCMHCKNSNHTGSRCDDCIPGYYGFPDCKGNINPMLDFRISLSLANSCFFIECNCDENGSRFTQCNKNVTFAELHKLEDFEGGKCFCKEYFNGFKCGSCKNENNTYPNCAGKVFDQNCVFSINHVLIFFMIANCRV